MGFSALGRVGRVVRAICRVAHARRPQEAQEIHLFYHHFSFIVDLIFARTSTEGKDVVVKDGLPHTRGDLHAVEHRALEFRS